MFLLLASLSFHLSLSHSPLHPVFNPTYLPSPAFTFSSRQSLHWYLARHMLRLKDMCVSRSKQMVSGWWQRVSDIVPTTLSLTLCHQPLTICFDRLTHMSFNRRIFSKSSIFFLFAINFTLPTYGSVKGLPVFFSIVKSF